MPTHTHTACMHACTHTHMHARTHTHTHTHKHTCTYACTHTHTTCWRRRAAFCLLLTEASASFNICTGRTHTHACMHAHTHTCMHTCTNACMYTHVHTHTHIHTCMHARMHTYARTHAHTHTHTHNLLEKESCILPLADRSFSVLQYLVHRNFAQAVLESTELQATEAEVQCEINALYLTAVFDGFLL